MDIETVIGLLKPSLVVNPPVAESNKLIRAATLVAIAHVDGETSFGLIKRAITAGPHSGEVSFPGGRIEESEEPLDAALREMEEEIGVGRGEVEVIGFLPVVETVITGFQVWPVVGVFHEPPEVRRAPDEVEEFFWAPMIFFTDRTNMSERNGRAAFWFEGREIWGLTLRIIMNLLSRIKPI